MTQHAAPSSIGLRTIALLQGLAPERLEALARAATDPASASGSILMVTAHAWGLPRQHADPVRKRTFGGWGVL